VPTIQRSAAPQTNDILGSDLVVATAASGTSSATVWPSTIRPLSPASAREPPRSTSGGVYPGGANAYRAALPAALRVRKTGDAQLLTNSQVWLSATARAQLLSGQIDPRLPLLIVTMAQSHPLRIVDFASQSPGGGLASLLRWVDLATTVRAAHLTRAGYLG
jgi:hypothetical protein